MKYIFILTLEKERYYIGLTHQHDLSINDLKHTNCNAWLRKYKPLSIHIRKLEINEDINTITLQYMEKYGINDVRGGYFSNLELDNNTLLYLKNKIIYNPQSTHSIHYKYQSHLSRLPESSQTNSSPPPYSERNYYIASGITEKNASKASHSIINNTRYIQPDIPKNINKKPVRYHGPVINTSPTKSVVKIVKIHPNNSKTVNYIDPYPISIGHNVCKCHINKPVSIKYPHYLNDCYFREQCRLIKQQCTDNLLRLEAQRIYPYISILN